VAEGEGDGSAGSGSGGGQSNNKSGLSEEVGDGNASDEDADDEATATATTGRASEVQLNNNDGGGGGDGGDDDDDDEGGGGEGGGRGSTTSGDGLDSSSSFTTLRPPEAWGGLQLDLSKCPENMSIANFGRDAKTQETLHVRDTCTMILEWAGSNGLGVDVFCQSFPLSLVRWHREHPSLLMLPSCSSLLCVSCVYNCWR
jgi:hypothetical protein